MGFGILTEKGCLGQDSVPGQPMRSGKWVGVELYAQVLGGRPQSSYERWTANFNCDLQN